MRAVLVLMLLGVALRGVDAQVDEDDDPNWVDPYADAVVESPEVYEGLGKPDESCSAPGACSKGAAAVVVKPSPLDVVKLVIEAWGRKTHSASIKHMSKVRDLWRPMPRQLTPVTPKDVVIASAWETDRVKLFRTYRGVERAPRFFDAFKALNVTKYELVDMALGANDSLVMCTVNVEMATRKPASFLDALVFRFDAATGMIVHIRAFTNPWEIDKALSSGNSASVGEKLASRLFGLLAARNLEAIPAMFDKDAVVLGMAPGPLHPELFRHVLATMISAFPDAVFEVEDVVAASDQVAVVYHFMGVNTKPFVRFVGWMRRTDSRVQNRSWSWSRR